MDNTLVYSIITTVSAIAFLVGTVLLIVSIVFTAKGKKPFVAGIICGALIGFCGMIFFVYGLFGQLIIGINTMVSNIPAVTEFTPAEGSRPISGTFKIDGDEVTLPCTVDDLTKLGYDTDYEYFDGYSEGCYARSDVYDLLNADKIVIEKSAMEKIQEVYA